MIKILHSADWHLDSAMQLGGESLRKALLEIPGKIAAICKQQQCDLVLLSGDLFDGAYTQDSLRILKNALEEMAVPVFITPGNHDFASVSSPWLREVFPENVHIFARQAIEYKDIPALSCRIYGAGFSAMDCPGLLEGFHAESEMRYNIGIFHGDPTQTASAYCPITTEQVKNSNLDYLALGHIHKGDRFTAGKTLCAWPGCPMGRGYDEQGQKGVLLVTLADTATAEFIPLDTPQFFDLECAVEELPAVLPPVGSENYYRITLVGTAEKPDLQALQATYPQFPNLVLRDRTVPPVDLWGNAGEDSFEGIYFGLLREAMENGDEETQNRVRLAAEISRKLLNGQEVTLP